MHQILGSIPLHCFKWGKKKIHEEDYYNDRERELSLIWFCKTKNVKAPTAVYKYTQEKNLDTK